MALLGQIIKENEDSIRLRPGEVVADIIIEENYFQLRTYAMGDTNREKGTKQNIQLSKQKAKELIFLLEQFVNS